MKDTNKSAMNSITRRVCLAPAKGLAAVLFLALLALSPLAVAQSNRSDAVEQTGCMQPATQIYSEVSPAVVQVMAYGIDPFQVINRVRAGSGSGVVLGEDLVLTNFHIVAGATAIAISSDANILNAEIVGTDPVLDIAVLKVPGIDGQTRVIEFASSEELITGQSVYVVGYPLGIGKSITSGIISGLGRIIPLNTSRWLSPYIQTDAPVSGGTSGGPLVDGCGRMIGMVTLQSRDPQAENMGYAIPVDTVRSLLPELIETGKVARPWHGIYGQISTPLIQAMMGMPFVSGFLVETVEPGSAADKAGIKGGSLPIMWGMHEIVLGGDLIIEVNGAPIRTLDEAVSAVRSLEIGQTVAITLLRDGEVIKTSALIEERPILERDLEPYRMR
jgi:putative serine protease PepD